jgi:penicillin-binding protein 1C
LSRQGSDGAGGAGGTLCRLMRCAGKRRASVLALAAAAAAAAVFFLVFCKVSTLPPYSTAILDRDGGLLSASIAADGQWRFPPDTAIPEKFILALTTSEDRRFFRHPGVDPAALCRALAADVRAKRFKQGGSTITMQLMRLQMPGARRTVAQKLLEIVFAVRETIVHSKRSTLARYAAAAPFGGNVVGLRAASWRYFGCEPGALTWAQAATLAVLPNSPGLVHPGRNRKTLEERRNRLLAVMRDRGAIDSMDCALAFREPLPDRPFPLPMLAPHLLARTEKEIAGPRARGAVRTTIRRTLQQRAMTLVMRRSRELAGNGIFNAAAVVADVMTGEVLAYVGNSSGGSDSVMHGRSVDVVVAPRSTGSILKPLLYGAMLEQGEILPRQLVPDIPTHMGGFSPQNYTRTFEGAVPACRALSRSLNVPSVIMLRSFGVERFADALKKAGMTTLHRPPAEYGMSLILGGAEGSLWDITGMYASIARSINIFFLNAPVDTNVFGPLRYLAESSAAGQRPHDRRRRLPVMGPAACYLTVQAMVEVERPEEELGWREFSSGRVIAWKTGTSFGYRDGWAVGITPDYVIGVWVGNADGEGRPGLTGIACAAPLLFDLFNIVPAGRWFERPESQLIKVEICRSSGMRAGPYCAGKDTSGIPFKGLQTPACRYCTLIHLDSTRRWRVTSECVSVSSMMQASWFVLPPSMEWYYRQKHGTYRQLPPFRKDCVPRGPAAGTPSLSLIYPHHEGTVYVPIELNGRRGRAVFEAAHRNAGATIFWHIDNEYLGATSGMHTMECAPSPGSHLLTIVDESGEERRIRFSVLKK